MSDCVGWHERLHRESRRMTGPRRAILQVLEKERRPLSNQEIHQQLPRGASDLATVYRSIQLLERMGAVKRFQFGDGVARFALVDERHQGHQHHLVCTRCASMVEIGDCVVRELERRVAMQSKFKAVTHRLEFFGICPACQ
ncbi:MAG TPA: Fur family transcriptional regulator [Verrucomicrobiae bacterium]|nr:Fur family transcriptional regulator [Verrucomicrobiae bacterium]